MDSTTVEIIQFIFNKQELTFHLIINLWLLLIISIVFLIGHLLFKKYLSKGRVHKEIIPVKLKYKYGGAEVEYNIIRNFENVEIAHKIYIELITRKVAIKIDEENDVIVELYDSWYSIFKITRDELKKLSGLLLIKNKTSEELVKLLTDILNKGLRPHLTKYQAKFRKWYNNALTEEKNTTLSPQEIQKKYNDYTQLVDSLKNVNILLIDYSKQLKMFIRGKK